MTTTLLMLLATAATPVDAGVPLTPTELFARTSGSVVVVRAGERMGSGVVVGKGLVITNEHVMNGLSSCSVTLAGRLVTATVRASSSAHDLALLAVDTGDARPVALRRSNDLVVGERVYAIGSPRGFEQTLSEGLVSGLRPEQRARVVQTSAPISPGSSGGGLFDEAGRLVGITTWQRLDGQNLNFANPVEWVEELLVAPPSVQKAPVTPSRVQRVTSANVPPALITLVRTLAEKGQFVSHVAFTPTGGWVLTWGQNAFEAVEVPVNFLKAYKAASARGHTLRGPSFSETGWAFFMDTAGFSVEGVSPDCTQALQQANASGERLTSLAMTKERAVLIRGTNGWWGTGVPEALEKALTTARDARDTIEVLAMRPDGVWVLVWKGGTAWTYSANTPTALVDALDREWKAGRTITHVALAPGGGWVVLSL